MIASKCDLETADCNTFSPRKSPAGSSHSEQGMTLSRRERPRITLPPLSVLTSAVDPEGDDFSRASTSTFPPGLSPPMRLGPSSQTVPERYGLARSPHGSVRHGQMSGSTSPVARNRGHPQEVPHRAPHLFLPRSRPRSLSSPHHAQLPPLSHSHRTQPPLLTELDRRLDDLMLVQGINRRLGLPIGPPASDSLMHHPEANDLLLDKTYDELDTLAQFSQGRAEALSRDLGLPCTPRYTPVRSPVGYGMVQHRIDAEERAPEPAESRPYSGSGYPPHTFPSPRSVSEEYLRSNQGSNYTHSSAHHHPQIATRHDGIHQRQSELLDRRHLSGKGMKRVRKRKNEHHQECLGCEAKETPEWRKGPMGPRTLCNACGLLYAKLNKRRQQDSDAAAKAAGLPTGALRERHDSPGARQASLEALRAELDLTNGMRNQSASISGVGSQIGGTADPTHEPSNLDVRGWQQQQQQPPTLPPYHAHYSNRGDPARTEYRPGHVYEHQHRLRAYTVGQPPNEAMSHLGSSQPHRSARSYTQLDRHQSHPSSPNRATSSRPTDVRPSTTSGDAYRSRHPHS